MQTIDEVQATLGTQGYICGRSLATEVFLSQRLGRPLFREGEAGTGQTEIAKAIAASLGRRLIRSKALRQNAFWTRPAPTWTPLDPSLVQ